MILQPHKLQNGLSISYEKLERYQSDLKDKGEMYIITWESGVYR